MTKDKEITDLGIYQPKSHILAKRLLNEIHSGIYLPGQKIGSIRELSKKYGVGRQVMLSAFEILAKANYIYTEVGRGSFVNPSLQVSKFYRIGFFVNCLNIAQEGVLLTELNIAAQKKGYRLILGSNFEEDWGFDDWLSKKKELDGVIITGVVYDKLLEIVKKKRFPYLVLGNYHISEAHPQVTIDIRSRVKTELKKVLQNLEFKTCALVAGRLHFKAVKETEEAYTDTLKELGKEVIPDLICHADGDGYNEAVFLHEHAKVKPDVIYIHGEFTKGFQKYYNIHGSENRPLIINNQFDKFWLDKQFYDYTLNTSSKLKPICNKAINNLLKQVGSS